MYNASFPILNQQSCIASKRKSMPRYVPWKFIEKFREKIEENHGQTLERLTQRGGLAPEELYVAAQKEDLRVLFRSAPEIADELEDKAIAWLYDELAKLNNNL